MKNQDFKIRIIGRRLKQEERQFDRFYYEIRHKDDDWGEPITIEKKVSVNHYGTIESTVDISQFVFLEKDYYKITEEERELIKENEDCGWIEGHLLFPSVE